MEGDIKCLNCGWEGYAIELESATENSDDREFIYCPNCGSDDIEDIEDPFQDDSWGDDPELGCKG